MQVKLLHPPGTEIYRNGNISMFEVQRCLCRAAESRAGQDGMIIQLHYSTSCSCESC